MKYIKQQILHERKIKDRQLVITNDGNIELTPMSGIVTVNGDLKVTGNATGATNELIYYVSLQGSDDNDGLGGSPDRAKKTVKSAVEAAPEGATIKLAPGDFYEDNPITLKPRQTVRGDSLRNCQVWPLNPTEDFFFVDNACYIFQITFRGLRDPGWCVRIKPGALVTTSPYVQNCSNINGPWLNDGTEFIPYETVQIEGVAPESRPIINNPDVPLAKRVNETGGGNGMLVDGNEYDPRSLVFSMVCDAFTQIAQGGIGFHITNFGYTQIVSCFTVFCRTGFLATNGGYLSISNSVSDFGTFGIIADGLFDTIYTTARPVQDYYSSIGSITVNSQGAGYTAAPAVNIEPPTTPGGVQATAVASIDAATGKLVALSMIDNGSGYDFRPAVTFVGGGFITEAAATANLVTNRIIEVNSLRDQPQVGSVIQFEGDSTYYYVTATNVTTQPFIYNEAVCRRDVRRIVDAIAGDMALGTNYQAIAAGKSYLRSRAQKVILQQLEATVYALEATRDEMLARIPDSDAGNLEARYDIIERFAEVINILNQGDSTSAPDIFWNDAVVDSGYVAAKDNILTNREFIIEEVNKYILDQFTNLSYNQDKCERDINLITVGTAYDVAFGTNFNAVYSGTGYARANASRVIDDQSAITLDTLAQLKSKIQSLSSVSSYATANTRAGAALDEIVDIVTDVINNVDITDAYPLVLPSPTGGLAQRTNAKNQLQINKEFIKAEIIAWITTSYPALDYPTASCARDVGYIVDALSYDILYGGNSQTRAAAQAYYVGVIAQLGSDATEVLATSAAYTRLQLVCEFVIQGIPLSKSAGNLETQDTSTYSIGTGVESDSANELLQYIIDVIDDGNLDNLVEVEYPSILWAEAELQTAHAAIFAQRNNFATEITDYILATYPNFTYDRTKCKRDVDLILDAVARDIKLGTNHNSIVAGLAYRRGTASVVDAKQLPATLLALRYLKTLALDAVSASLTATTRCTDVFDTFLQVVEYGTLPSEGTTYPAPGTASQQRIDAARQLQDNKDFLVAETIAWINDNYFVYDAAKCARDTALILDAVGWDLTLGTNYFAVTAGLAYRNANASGVIDNQLVETVGAITHLKSQVALLIAAYSSALTRSNAAFDEIIDILQNGTGSADALTWSDPSVDTNKLYAREQLQANKTFIIAEITAWIADNYPLLSYNVATCERDVGYIVDAISTDVQYGGNIATKQSAKLYFEGTASVLPEGELAATVAAYRRLEDLLGDIVIEAPVTKTAANVESQDTAGTAASSTEADEVSGLMDIIINALVAGNIDNLPADEDYSLAWVSSAYTDARDLIVASGDSSGADLVQEVINYINTNYNGLSYNETKCARDTGYLVDAITHDLLYSGNRSILISTRAYFDDGISTIIGQEIETAAAIEHLRDVSTLVIEGASVTPSVGNIETQSLVSGFGTSTESTISEGLYNILITAITDELGLGTTPSNSNPDYTWVSAAVIEAANVILTNSVTYQQDVIDYISNNIIGFTFNQEKCARDTGYIIDAALYDMMYGGNKQTRRAGEAYYNGAILANAVVGTVDQIAVTEYALKYLADTLSKVAQNQTVTLSDGNILSQVISATNGSSNAGSYIFTIVEKISEVVQGGDAALPTEIDHDYTSYADSLLNAKRVLILNDLDAIEEASIRALNLEFGGVAELTLFPGVVAVVDGTIGNMQNVSTVSTAGHAFEYVGAGITYNALPFFGGTPIPANEYIESNIGKVFAGGTVDQIGNFKVGNFFQVNALTGAITLNANEINLSGISSIGPFQRDGIPVGVELKEVSTSTNMSSSTGSPDQNTVPTQTAVVSYVENRYLNKLTGGTVEGDVTFETNIAVDGGEISTISSTFDLIADNANVVNFATGATDITIGATIGTTNIRNDLILDGTADITGDVTIIGDFNLTIPDEVQQAFNVTQGTEDYISVDTRQGTERVTFGGQPRIEIDNTTQSQSGTLNTGALVVAGGVGIAKNVSIGGDLYFEGTIISTSSGSLSLFNNAAGSINAFGAATEINIGSSGIIPGNFTVANDYIEFTSVYNMKIPTGNIGERGVTLDQGYIRFNTTLGQFEGYDGIAWNSLGGVRDVDGNTYITPESAPGANENILSFVTDGFERMALSTSELLIDPTITKVWIEGTTQSTSPDNGQLIVDGGVGIEKNLNVRGNIRGYNNALFEGDLTATGNATFGTLDSVVDTFTANANAVFNVWDNTVQAFEVLEGSNSYFKLTTTDGSEEAVFDTPIVKINNATASTDSSTGALIVTGGVGIGGSLYVAGGFTVGGSIVFGNEVDVDTFTVIGDTDFTIPDNNSEAFRIDQSTNNYFNIATTDGSELVSFGTTPKVFIRNTTDASSKDAAALVVDGGVGIELNTYIGVDLFVGRNTVLTGDLAVNGGDLTTTATTFNLVNTNATTVNFAGAATAINIGAATGIITINNEQVIFDSVKSIQIPVGGNADRPSAITGQIRFNSDALVFEGYDGIAWGSLGGVKDVDQNTFIRPETSPGANNNELEFYTDGVKRMGLGTSELIIDSTINTTFEATTTSTSDVTGALVIAGGVGIAENLYVGGRIGGDIQIGEDITSILTIIGETILAPDSLRIISNAPDSAADDIVYPVTFAHHSISGTPTAGSGTGVKFELETSNDNFETGGKIDVVVQDVTGTQEDFDMVFSTMISGSVAEKFRIGELTATFEDNVAIKGGSLTTDQTTFNLLNTTATTVNFASDGTIISIGSISGTTTVNHNLHVTGTISTDVDLEVQYGGTGVRTFTTDGILYGNAADPLQVTDAAGTSDTSVSFQKLTVTSDVGATPVWTDTIDGGSF